MNKRILFLIPLFLCSALSAQSQVTVRSLNQGWTFREAGSSREYPAQIPSCVQTDLLSLKLIADPYAGTNERKDAWIEEKNWEYRCNVSIDEEFLKKENIVLIFEGLDTHADVFLNGISVLQADNMFRTYKINVKEILKAGSNELKILFYSSAKTARESYKALPAPLPYDERVCIRKAPYQFGWDWGPKQLSIGIWKDVFLMGWNTAKIKDFSYQIHKLDPALAELNFTAVLECSAEAKLDLELCQDNKTVKTLRLNAKAGSNNVNIPASLKNPRLWWPNGMGEAWLYPYTLRLCYGGNIIDSAQLRVGLRTIELVRESDNAGSSFFFKVNGRAFFAKGANLIPPDIFPSRVKDSTYLDLVKDAADSRMNMLRVWGGGYYLHDKFYDYCDEYGILVWQDFMFACAMYPGDSAFLDNVREEVIDQVLRLRSHPSLALWCGNNEVDEGWNNWGMQKQYGYSADDSARIKNDYDKLFKDLIPSVIERYDASRPYHSSSPLYGWGRKESMTHGDSHYWGVWWGEQLFEIYNAKVPRFMSEYGFQGCPDSATLASFGMQKPDDMHDSALLIHQKHPRGFEIIGNAMDYYYGKTSDFSTWTQRSRFLQCDAMQIAIEAQRRSMPYCMGSLYWQFNDCWPVISWSTRSYSGIRKPSQYLVKRLYSSCMLSVVTERDSIKVYAVSDSSGSIGSRLKLSVCAADGTILWNVMKELNMPPASSLKAYAIPVRQLIPKFDSCSSFIYAELGNAQQRLCYTTHFLCRPKNFKAANADIRYTITEIDSLHTRISLQSKVPVFKFQIDETKAGSLSDNYIDLMPWRPVSIIASRHAFPPASVLSYSYFRTLHP
jgi:beta-mannosidase